MTDREKVIEAVECMKNAHKRCGNPCEMTGLCAYASQVRSPDGEPYYPFYCDTERLCVDVLALLRKHEPVELTDDGDDFVSIGDRMEITHRWKCGGCGNFVVYCETRPKIKFCHLCGREFKPNDQAGSH